MLTLSIYKEVPPPPLDPCRFIVDVWGDPHHHKQVLEMTDDEAHELYVLLSQHFQKPKRARRKGAKK